MVNTNATAQLWHAAAREIPLGVVLYASACINVVCINVNGLREEGNRKTLRKLLRDLQVGVAILSKTHLRKADLKRMNYPNYHIKAKFCSKTLIGERIDGGVVILK